jgi:hypothetical protein
LNGSWKPECSPFKEVVHPLLKTFLQAMVAARGGYVLNREGFSPLNAPENAPETEQENPPPSERSSQ